MRYEEHGSYDLTAPGGFHQGGVVMIATGDTLALDPRPSESDLAVRMAWKGSTEQSVWPGPLPCLGTVALRRPPVPRSVRLTWPMETFDGDNCSGWNPLQFRCAMDLALRRTGQAVFSGSYVNEGNIPLADGPSHDYGVAMVVVGAKNQIFTFVHSAAGVATSGPHSMWNESADRCEIAAHWDDLVNDRGVVAIIDNAFSIARVMDGLMTGVYEEVVEFVETLLGDVATCPPSVVPVTGPVVTPLMRRWPE